MRFYYERELIRVEGWKPTAPYPEVEAQNVANFLEGEPSAMLDAVRDLDEFEQGRTEKWSAEGNAHVLIIGGNVVRARFSFFGEDDEAGDSFHVSRAEFLDALQAWAEFQETRTKHSYG